MKYRGPGLLAVLWFGSSPAPPVSNLDRRHKGRLRQLDDGRWGGEGRAQSRRQRESLVLYKSFNTLCSSRSNMACVCIPDMQRRIYYIFISSRKVFANTKRLLECEREVKHTYMCAITYNVHRDTQMHMLEHKLNKSKCWVFFTMPAENVPVFFFI